MRNSIEIHKSQAPRVGISPSTKTFSVKKFRLGTSSTISFAKEIKSPLFESYAHTKQFVCSR